MPVGHRHDPRRRGGRVAARAAQRPVAPVQRLAGAGGVRRRHLPAALAADQPVARTAVRETSRGGLCRVVHDGGLQSPVHQGALPAAHAARSSGRPWKRLSPEHRREVLQALPPEERLAGLSAEQIRQYLDELIARSPTGAQAPVQKVRVGKGAIRKSKTNNPLHIGTLGAIPVLDAQRLSRPPTPESVVVRALGGVSCRSAPCIADWDQLRRYQDQHGQDMSEAGDWYRSSSFTGWTQSVRFNDAVGDLFLDIRGSLPADAARALEEFLVAFCPRVADESEFAPPQSPGVRHDAYYAGWHPMKSSGGWGCSMGFACRSSLTGSQTTCSSRWTR